MIHTLIIFFFSFAGNPYIAFSFLREKNQNKKTKYFKAKKYFVKPGQNIEFVLQHWSDSCPLGRKTNEISLEYIVKLSRQKTVR